MSPPPPPSSTATFGPSLRGQPLPADTERYTLRQRRRPWLAHQKLVAISFLGDAAMVVIGLLAAYAMRFETSLREVGVFHEEIDFQSYMGHIIFGAILFMALLANFRLHDPRHFLSLRRTTGIILKCGAAWLAAYLGLALILKFNPSVSRVYCVLAALSTTSLLLAWRGFFHTALKSSKTAASLRQKAVFIGWNDECTRAVQRLSGDHATSVQIVGVITPPVGSFTPPATSKLPVLGGYKDRRHLLRESGADIVLAVDDAMAREDLVELAEVCGREFIDFKLVPSCFQVLLTGLQLENINGMPVLGVSRLPLHHAFNHYLKRGVDIIGSLIGLAVFSPIIALFALLVYRESPAPVFYRQRRIGINGKPFWIYKIRSMKPDAEKGGKPGWTISDDPRRLRVGAFMRRWNIDELPQFWNVLRGDMSLVGPRPERPELIEDFKEEIPWYNVRHNIKPGITGWAQVNGLRGDTCLFERVKYDLHYIENWNIMLDLQIMAMTFYSRRGAC